ncbi:DUF3467 domain-containing protein [Agromyces ramosus]|uniref:DUF3467 domain-containing protein n=1 Tax=Agromyces ramosus TaxID=33879 RepID=A0ABU0R3A0_9MICO|nr:DUF3467 domain-containing protein [Agromyces ramosus]MDQ0892544.1 hypothetical protein [Agromyces ramosus]
MTDPVQRPPMEFAVSLPPEQEVGVFADFANIWHTPNTFVLDFLTVKRPAHASADAATGQPPHAVLESRVAARVRIPPEQIFMLIKALQTQGDQWLAETGRVEPPDAWAPHGPGQ